VAATISILAFYQISTVIVLIFFRFWVRSPYKRDKKTDRRTDRQNL